MATSLFIAKLLGPTALLAGLVILFQPARIQALAREALQGEAFIFIAGMLSLVTGLAILNTHNVCALDWRVVITLFGWLAVLSGVVRIGFGRVTKTIGMAMGRAPFGFAVPGAFLAMIGAWLSAVGYLV